MKYRTFGKVDFKPSALGFGSMRLPVLNNDPTKIDEKQAMDMVKMAVDSGINYFDTAYDYHAGQSEIFLGKALKNYRDKIKIATKLPIESVATKDDPDKILSDQLCRLQTDHIDFYLLHALNKKRHDKVKDLNILEWAQKVLKQGKIRHLGFSFHDELPVFRQIVDGYDKWEFCQIQYNFMDENFQAGKEGLKYAHHKGLAVVIMEPLKGGMLVNNPPQTVKKIWTSAKIKKSPVEWALRWLWSQPEVSLVLSGMSSLNQLKDNLGLADKIPTNPLTPEENLIYQRVSHAYQQLCPVLCTGCRYCLPCPNGVKIPDVFRFYKELVMFSGSSKTIKYYYNFMKPEAKASNCASCHKCEPLCPQKIKIADILKKADQTLN